MVYASLLKIASLAALVCVSSAANINVKNNCAFDIAAIKLDNGGGAPANKHVAKGQTATFTVAEKWSGRVSARKLPCNGPQCTTPEGTTNPASLAEINLKENSGKDTYDISLVDGYNLPLSIVPINPKKAGGDPSKDCGVPKCATLPKCPAGYNVPQYGACQSQCSKTNDDKYCCRGAFADRGKCVTSKVSDATKKACPDAYSYAYDDATSTYSCKATGYTVVFCPAK